LILKLPTVWSARFGLSARYSRPARLPLGKSHRQTSSALRRATVLMARKSICCLGEGVCRREGELVFFNIAKFLVSPAAKPSLRGFFRDGAIRRCDQDARRRLDGPHPARLSDPHDSLLQLVFPEVVFESLGVVSAPPPA
jgi:hypothetical protein